MSGGWCLLTMHTYMNVLPFLCRFDQSWDNYWHSKEVQYIQCRFVSYNINQARGSQKIEQLRVGCKVGSELSEGHSGYPSLHCLQLVPASSDFILILWERVTHNNWRTSAVWGGWCLLTMHIWMFRVVLVSFLVTVLRGGWWGGCLPYARECFE